ncbi:hypothetical protein BN946_scf184965.g6 [Trametes cinnabarina]|uniref:RNA-dependent RNA polymerase n=1 Tax=Pycnoporus cinnabarinus TaxID=5643 RepID=A0A060SS04_PYCCI|nr:hypothetical protein BN946_scf184965.g6 [Trametes cinnabarina]
MITAPSDEMRLPDVPYWRRAKPSGSHTSIAVARSQLPSNMWSFHRTPSSSTTVSTPAIPQGTFTPAACVKSTLPALSSSLSHSASVPHVSPIHALPPLPEWQPPPPVVVGASPSRLQAAVLGLPWGAQWELARFIATGFDAAALLKPKDIASPELKGKNAKAAPQVKKLVEQKLALAKAEEHEVSKQFAVAFQRERAVKSPWEELDREEEILCEHPLGGIGCNSDQSFLENDPDWYGGRIHFTAQLRKEKGSSFSIILDRPQLGTSNRLARRFGSRRIIRVRLQKDIAWNTQGNELRDYFKRPFIIAGVVFRAFYAKEQNVFLFRTNEGFEQHADGTVLITQPSVSCRGQQEYSWLEFIGWHNRLEHNTDQTMVKWSARFALGLSNSIPGVRLHPSDVRFIPDIICDSFKGPGKPPSEMQMTDGCGFTNRALMRALKAKFPTWPEEPTAIQFRLAGGKGLALVRHDLSPEDEERPTLWLRPSQLKINYTDRPPQECIVPDDADPAWVTLDILRASHMNTPIRLSAETITNLAENGVPHSCFVELFKLDIQERIGPLLNFAIPESPKDMQALWYTIARTGAVMLSRVTREAVGIARAAGYVMEDDTDELEDEDEDGLKGLDKALQDGSSAWWEDPISGLPSRLDETCLTLLDSGFTPSKCPVLRAKLREFVKQTITTYRSNYRFIVPMSCAAFIVPDPFGVLGANEIHVKCSRRDFLDPEGRKTDIVIGDVLVKAVFHEKLRHYYDVIVVSTKSHLYQGKSLDRHLASLTGGGDYDGDTLQVFWDPRIVTNFKEPNLATEPPDVQKCLVKDTTTVSAFLAAMPPSAPYDYKIFAMQHYLLGALRSSSHVSLYSTWWEKSTYVQGYAHPETVFLAYMFCAVLDGLKTGVSVDPKAFAKHRDKWSVGALLWKTENSDDNRILSRPSHRSLFIMDVLQRQVKLACEQLLGRIEDKLGHPRSEEWPCRACREDHVGCSLCDADLVQPWLDARTRARELQSAGQPGMWDELEVIKQHVEEMHEQEKDAWRAATSGRAAGAGTTSKRGKARFTDLPIEKRQDILREQSKRFHAAPENLRYLLDPTVVKASYAYFYDHQVKGWSRFPWNVAARALCEIKAKASGPSKTISGDFYMSMAVSPLYVRQYISSRT